MKAVVQLPKGVDPNEIPGDVRTGVPFTTAEGRVLVMEEAECLDLGVLEQGVLKKVDVFYVIRAAPEGSDLAGRPAPGG